MSALTDLIFAGSNGVAGLTEGAVNDAIAKYGAEQKIAFPDTAYFFPPSMLRPVSRLPSWATCPPVWRFSRA